MEELLAFLKENVTPLVGQKTRSNAPTRYSKLPLVVIYYNVDFSLQYRDGTQYWRQKILDIANKVIKIFEKLIENLVQRSKISICNCG